MTGKKSKKLSANELPTEIIVAADWAEAQMAKGLLSLTPQQIKVLEGGSTIKLPADVVDRLNPPKIRKTPREWIEPIEAVHWLSPKMGGDAAAKSAIAERLRDGAIECTNVWMSKGPDVGPISTQRPQFPSITSGTNTAHWVTPIDSSCGQVIMGGAFWSYSDDWDADLKRWDWRFGLFVTSANELMTVVVDGLPKKQLASKSRNRMVVSGIRFNRAEIEKLDGEVPQAKLPKPASRRGNKKGDRWAVWFAEVLIYAKSKGLDTNQSAADFYQVISELIYDRDPDLPYLEFTTVEKTIGIIMDRWSEAKSNREI